MLLYKTYILIITTNRTFSKQAYYVRCPIFKLFVYITTVDEMQLKEFLLIKEKKWKKTLFNNSFKTTAYTFLFIKNINLKKWSTFKRKRNYNKKYKANNF